MIALCATRDVDANEDKEYASAVKSCFACPSGEDAQCCSGERCIAVRAEEATCSTLLGETLSTVMPCKRKGLPAYLKPFADYELSAQS